MSPKSQLTEVAEKFPFPVLAFRGDEVEEALIRLRKEQAGRAVPVILGDAEHALRMLDLWDEEPFDLEADLRGAVSLDVDTWLKEQREEAAEWLDDEMLRDHEKVHAGGTAPMTRLQAGFDHRNRPLLETFFALVPTADATTLPLHLRFGGWNACPDAPVHTAFARRWQARHGAEIASMAGDIVEYTVARPPQDDAEALALAWEMYLYCSDIVDQGVGSVATLAQALRKSTRWYFWWD